MAENILKRGRMYFGFLKWLLQGYAITTTTYLRVNSS